MSDQARYLYGISRYLTTADVEGLRGLGGAPVRVIDNAGLAAVVSDVGLDEFGEDALSRHLNDLDWLSGVARTHHTVVSEVALRAPTAPLRLATVCLDDSGVRARLDESASALHRSLDRISGRAEWSVKVFAGAAPAPGSPAGEASSAGSGREYLARRKAQAAHREEAVSRAADVASDVHDQLTRLSADATTLAAQDSRLSGEGAPMTLNAAYLVDDDSAGEFRAAVDALSRRYANDRLDLAGPWPAYSFVRMDQR